MLPACTCAGRGRGAAQHLAMHRAISCSKNQARMSTMQRLRNLVTTGTFPKLFRTRFPPPESRNTCFQGAWAFNELTHTKFTVLSESAGKSTSLSFSPFFVCVTSQGVNLHQARGQGLIPVTELVAFVSVCRGLISKSSFVGSGQGRGDSGG